MKYKIYNQDVIEWAHEYQKGKFHALISDTPYHLQSIVKRFGKKNSAPAKHGTDGVFSRSSKGFMGQTWDGGDIAFRPETWEALGEHLYPGAFGMCFSASRNWHRLAVAIEDAGFIIHPTIFGWLNGQGFPKATRIDTQIQPKSEQTVVGKSNRHNSKTFGKGGGNPVYNTHPGGVPDATIPTNETAKRWMGYRYGLQALKPAVEPIIVFQKPYEGKPLDNIVETGAGALNIDGGRIPVDNPVIINRFTKGAKPWGNAKGEEFETVETSQGRWPANFILDESAAQQLDTVNGNHASAKSPSSVIASGQILKGKRSQGNLPMDDGGVSRYFFNVQEQIDKADPIYYCGKVSKTERNSGLDNQCIHPTMKPIALAKYLATLLLPPEEYAPRRILVPFSGVGSEMIGAALAGWEQIVGIEFDTENDYVGMAHKRIEYWTNK